MGTKLLKPIILITWNERMNFHLSLRSNKYDVKNTRYTAYLNLNPSKGKFIKCATKARSDCARTIRWRNKRIFLQPSNIVRSFVPEILCRYSMATWGCDEESQLSWRPISNLETTRAAARHEEVYCRTEQVRSKQTSALRSLLANIWY
jgi:hypothetical protein